MPYTLGTLLVGTLSFALAGCCTFVPCHPATSLAGTVAAADGVPVSSIRIKLYGTSVTADSKGCFKVRLPDASPFTFVVSAEGYKPIEVEAKRGFYRAKVELIPVQSTETSRTEWVPMTSSEHEAYSCR